MAFLPKDAKKLVNGVEYCDICAERLTQKPSTKAFRADPPPQDPVSVETPAPTECSRCSSFFGSDKYFRLGDKYLCRECARIYMKDRQQRDDENHQKRKDDAAQRRVNALASHNEKKKEQNAANDRRICGACGCNLGLGEGLTLNGELFCHSCYTKLNDDFVVDPIGFTRASARSTVFDKAPNKDLSSLRRSIIDRITREPALEYRLASLLWQDATRCFPGPSFNWDSAQLMLDLVTGKLFAELSTYPNQFGACREGRESLSAERFNEIARSYNFESCLLAMETNEDWESLFDEDLRSAILIAKSKLERKKADLETKKKQENAKIISSEVENKEPSMIFAEISVELSQMYSSRKVKIVKESGKYSLDFTVTTYTDYKTESYGRCLTAKESLWLEKRLTKMLKSSDRSTWQSFVGYDKMNVFVRSDTETCEDLISVDPIEKYTALMNELEKIARYGS